MNSSASILRDALLDDSLFVLQLVVAKLYRGSNLRPDAFFGSNAKLQQKKYNKIFTYEQRLAIERSGLRTAYNISSASKEFDVSLLALLAEHTCGLSSSDPLLKKVLEVRNQRNSVCHNGGSSVVTDAALSGKLSELLELYIEILDLLEERSYSDLSSEKAEVRRRIEEKRMRNKLLQEEDSRAVALYTSISRASPVRTYPISRTLYGSSSPDEDDDDDDYYPRVVQHRSAANSSSEIPTWGKVALGVTAGIAALGLVGAAAADSANRNESPEERRRRERRDDDCAIM